MSYKAHTKTYVAHAIYEAFENCNPQAPESTYTELNKKKDNI